MDISYTVAPMLATIAAVKCKQYDCAKIMVHVEDKKKWMNKKERREKCVLFINTHTHSFTHSIEYFVRVEKNAREKHVAKWNE